MTVPGVEVRVRGVNGRRSVSGLKERCCLSGTSLTMWVGLVRRMMSINKATPKST